MTKKHFRHRPRDSFTLVEMLVSIAILSILSIALFSVLFGVSVSWQKAQGQIERRQNGRAIMDYMSRELRSAALPTNRGDTNNLQFVVNPVRDTVAGSDAPTKATYYLPTAVFWQMPIPKSYVDPTSKQISATRLNTMAEVGYFIRWDTTKAANPRGILCRFFSNPDDPLTGQDYLISPGSFNASTYKLASSSHAWLTDNILDSVAPGIAVPKNPFNRTPAPVPYQGFFAENVIGLWVRCLDPMGNTIINTGLQTGKGSSAVSYSDYYAYDSRLGYSYYSDGTYTGSASGSLIIKNGFFNIQGADTSGSQGASTIMATLPATVEIAMVMITSEGAQKITRVPTYPALKNPASSQNGFWPDMTAFITQLNTDFPGTKGETTIYSTQVRMDRGN